LFDISKTLQCVELRSVKILRRYMAVYHDVFFHSAVRMSVA